LLGPSPVSRFRFVLEAGSAGHAHSAQRERRPAAASALRAERATTSLRSVRVPSPATRPTEVHPSLPGPADVGKDRVWRPCWARHANPRGFFVSTV
jgi:hypothetical protein